MRIETDIKLDFDDVLIKPKRSSIPSRAHIELERTYKMKHSDLTWTGVPIIAANMFGTGTTEMAQALQKHKIMTALHKFHDEEKLANYFFDEPTKWKYIFYTMGINKDDEEKLDNVSIRLYKKRNNITDNTLYPKVYLNALESVNKHFPLMINIDVANGYTEYFNDKVKEIRRRFPNSIIMAGNIVSYEMTQQLILSGADIVKIGIGQGSCCTTRVKTGCGYPQLSSIAECADAAHGLGGLICADGGCRCTGDICKSFGAGADFVMLGGMLAGTDECGGEWTYECSDNNQLTSRQRKNISDFLNSMDDDYEDDKLDDGPFTILLRENRLSFLKKEFEQNLEHGDSNVATFKTIRTCYNILKIILDDAEGYSTEKRYLEFYGMASEEAQEDHSDGMKDYRTSEGKCVLVPHRGPVSDVIQDITGGLRSACTYVGATKLKDFSKCCTFIRVNRQYNDIFGKSM